MGNIRESQENGGVVLSEEQKKLLKMIGEQYTQNQADRKIEEKEKEKRIQEILERNKKESIEGKAAIAVKQAKDAIKHTQKENGEKKQGKEREID